MLFETRAVAAPELQAATCFQPNLQCPVRQLHHVFKPGSPQGQQQWRVCARFREQQSRWSVLATPAAASDAAANKAPDLHAATFNASDVKAAFAEAALSQDAVDHILKQYPYYLRWDVEDKLLPAIQSWQQELGASFLSEVERVPTLLSMKPAEELLKNQYLVSLGIKSPERLRKRSPCVLRQSLTSLQSKVAFLQGWGFPRPQMVSLIEKNPDVLLRTSVHIGELLRLVEDI